MTEKTNGQTLSERLQLPADIEVNVFDNRSRTKVLAGQIRDILGDKNIRVFFANSGPAKPQRLSELGEFGYRVLRWSDLTSKEARALERILPYKPDDLCRWADTVIMVAHEGAVRQRQQYKTMLSDRKNRHRADELSVAALARDLGDIPGVKVEDNPSW